LGAGARFRSLNRCETVPDELNSFGRNGPRRPAKSVPVVSWTDRNHAFQTATARRPPSRHSRLTHSDRRVSAKGVRGDKAAKELERWSDSRVAHSGGVFNERTLAGGWLGCERSSHPHLRNLPAQPQFY